jgi:hypothetical protein
MHRWAALAVAVLFLSSCIGLESRLSFRQDGSGTLTLSYKVSQFMKNIDAGRDQKSLPLPVSREDFERAVLGIPGLSLRAIEQREDEENVYINASLAFDTVEAINEFSRRGGMGLTITAQGGGFVCRQEIIGAREPGEISEDSQQMIQTFFAGYELAYSVAAPASIRSYSLGQLDDSGRVLTYRVSIPDLLKSNEAKVLEVVW